MTDRTTNSAVTFISAYGAGGGMPRDVDWPALAQAGGAIVVYMALSRLDEIAAALMAGGRPAGEPVAIVSHATLDNQHVLETTLGRCVADVAAAALEPPAMMVVGEVVRLRAALDWLGAMTTGRRLEPDPLGRQDHRHVG